MALYHLHVEQIKRSAGQSSVAAAAYRAGEKLYDDYYGELQDYTRKGGVVLSEIHLPSHAPEKFLDRETLWNEVEWVEKNKKAQLAHSYDIALMQEFSLEENIELARRFVEEQFVSRGMIADLAVHVPEKNGGNPNPHIHVMIPIRPLNADGSWGIKEKKIPVLDEEGNPVLNKNGKPKMTAVSVTGWSSKETLLEIRQAWADINNQLFTAKGLDERIDWRSYETQGIEKLPTIHEGPVVRKLEAKGIETELGALNRLIRSVNAYLTQVKEIRQWLQARLHDLVEALHRIPEPTLAAYLIQYYDERNRVAETFQYGTNKAKRTNLQEHSKVIAFLQNENITTPTELNARLNLLENSYRILRNKIHEKQTSETELKKRLQKFEQYKKNQKVFEAYEQKVFGKKKFYEEHEKEIRSYHAAKKYLKPFLNENGKLPKAVWEREVRELSAERDNLEQELQKLIPDLQMLRKVEKAVETALQFNQKTDEQEAISRTALQKEKQQKSIHERLSENKEKVQQKTANKQKKIERDYL